VPFDRELLKRTDYGRSEGWDVELDGRAIAYLDQPVWEDMFWVSYRITPSTDDAALAVRLLTEEFWRGEEWLNMRALYLTTDTPDLPESAARGDPPPRPAGGLIHRLRDLLRRGPR